MSGVRASQPVQKKLKMQAILYYIRSSFDELKSNITWTERGELQRLISIVLAFSILFSLAIWGADTVLSRVVQFYFNLLG